MSQSQNISVEYTLNYMWLYVERFLNCNGWKFVQQCNSFKTTEWCKACITALALALLDQTFNSFCPPLVNAMQRFLNSAPASVIHHQLVESFEQDFWKDVVSWF